LEIAPDADQIFTAVKGTFYRAIDPAYKSSVIAGSRLAGRYSTAQQPTLYLSATHEGMQAAIGVHEGNRAAEKQVVRINVTGTHIFDLRDAQACLSANIRPNDAIAPWQDVVNQGKRPPSWGVRDSIIALGGKGLMDPSRQKPGLWHLVLFEWNQKNAPRVEVLE
jgi:RES domain-containing protein